MGTQIAKVEISSPSCLVLSQNCNRSLGDCEEYCHREREGNPQFLAAQSPKQHLGLLVRPIYITCGAQGHSVLDSSTHFRHETLFSHHVETTDSRAPPSHWHLCHLDCIPGICPNPQHKREDTRKQQALAGLLAPTPVQEDAYFAETDQEMRCQEPQ